MESHTNRTYQGKDRLLARRQGRGIKLSRQLKREITKKTQIEHSRSIQTL